MNNNNQKQRQQNANQKLAEMRVKAWKTTFYIISFIIFFFYWFNKCTKSKNSENEDNKELSSENENGAKTEFNSCDELIEYLQFSTSLNHTYTGWVDCRKDWGDESIKVSDPNCTSDICTVNVLFEKIKVNGVSPWLIFEADATGKPTSWCLGVDCDKTGNIPTNQYN